MNSVSILPSAHKPAGLVVCPSQTARMLIARAKTLTLFIDRHLVLPFVITLTYAGGLLFRCKSDSEEPASPSGAGGGASSALSLGAYVTVITKGST